MSSAFLRPHHIAVSSDSLNLAPRSAASSEPILGRSNENHANNERAASCLTCSDTPHRRDATRSKFYAIIRRQNQQPALPPVPAPAASRMPYFRDDKLGISIEHCGEQFHLKTRPPPLARLVFSGGGAKGAAYAGGVNALERTGVLDRITTMYGSSAGAITATLLACGISAEQFERLSNSMNFLKLIAKDGKDPAPAQDEPASAEEAATLRQGWRAVVKERWNNSRVNTMASLLRNCGTTAPRLYKLIRETTRETVLARIDAASNPAEVEDIRQRLQDQGACVTFNDLARLSAARVPGIRQLHCTGTAIIESKAQLAVFNAEHTPHMPVAEAARISGAFPGVFAKVDYSLPHNQPNALTGAKGEVNRALAVATGIGAKTTFMDGGVMLNTPVPALLDDASDADDLLVFAFEDDELRPNTPDVPHDESKPRMPLTSGFPDYMTETDVTAADNFLRSQLRSKVRQDVVVVPLRVEGRDYTGFRKGTLNFKMSNAEKRSLQLALEKQTMLHLNRRESRRDEKSSGSLHDVLHTFDNATLIALQKHLDPPMDPDRAEQTPNPAPHASKLLEAVQAIRDFREALSPLMDNLTEAVAQAAKADRFVFDATLSAHLKQVSDHAAGDPGRLAYIARGLASSSHSGVQRMLAAARGQKAAEEQPLLKETLKIQRERELRTVAMNIGRQFIHRALTTSGQSASNIALLCAFEEELAQAKTPSQFNLALDAFTDGYKTKHSSINLRFPYLQPAPENVRAAAKTILSTIVMPVLHQMKADADTHDMKALTQIAANLGEVRNFDDLKRALDKPPALLEAQLRPYLARLKKIAGDPLLLEAQTYRLREE
ncbi:MAG TPA: patatin-like phospholipase family protein [Noviherbaspirillum sp.]